MTARAPRRPSVAAALLGLVSTTLAVGLTTVTAPAAQAVSSTVVISEVYGGGGNSGATFTHDFIELYNPSPNPVNVSGWSVQYRSNAGTTAQVTNLTGTIPSGSRYLVREASQAAVGSPIPAPEASGDIAMAAGGGVVLLVPNTTPFTSTGDLAGNPGLIDMVGYGIERARSKPSAPE